MADNSIYIDQIERYLAGKMSGEEFERFESALDTDKDLAGAFKEYLRSEVAVLTDAREAQEQDLTARYHKLKPEQKMAEPESKTESAEGGAKVRRLGPLHILTALAACLALFFLIRQFAGGTEPQTMEQMYAQHYEPASIPEVKSVQSGDSLWQQAFVYMKSKEYDKAIDAFDLVLQDVNFTKKSDAWLYMGHAFIQLKQYKKAVLCYQRVTDQVQTAEWYTCLAYLGLNDKDGAMAMLSRLLEYPYYKERASQMVKTLKKIQT